VEAKGEEVMMVIMKEMIKGMIIKTGMSSMM
jgi:hypothetical protein